jgi:ATP-binding protein involved in chromosome partitioning
VPLLGQIPPMPEVRAGGDSGTPIVVSDPDSPAGAALLETARTLAETSRTMVKKPLGLTVAPGTPVTVGHGHEGPESHAGHQH